MLLLLFTHVYTPASPVTAMFTAVDDVWLTSSVADAGHRSSVGDVVYYTVVEVGDVLKTGVEVVSYYSEVNADVGHRSTVDDEVYLSVVDTEY